MVIAIDGPGGVGKSTVAQRVARVLDLAYLDTGATYRAVTLAVLDAGAEPEHEAAVLAVLEGVDLAFGEGEVYLEGREVSAEIRSPQVTAAVSAVSAHPAVRERVVAMQRSWVVERGEQAVVEGRDIGTVVFAEAPVKVFLDATPEVRAARRAGDAEVTGRDVSRISTELAARDHADTTRDASPLQPADDAVVIDTTSLDIEEVVAEVLALVQR